MAELAGPVAFIGLGKMGLPMATRLVEAGIAVRGFDVSAAAVAALAERGATATESAADAVDGASVVVLMLPDSSVVEAVANDLAVRAALKPGTTIVDMSSSEPARTKALAAALAGIDVTLVDAPVSGGVTRAISGQLAVMVGGPDETVDALEPLLARLGTIYRAGDVGSGHAVKALNNLMSAAHLLVTSEALLAARRFGLDVARVLEIVNNSSGRSGSTENKWPNFVLPGTFDSGFALRLMLKDMRIAVGLADQVGLPARYGADAVSIWAEAADALPAEADHTEIARWLEERTA